MYHQHFGLSGPPFQFTPTPDALYLSQTHRECLAALEWGLLHEPTGFTLMVGDSGVGKTTLVCAALARRYRNLRAAFINNPKLNFDQMMQVVMSQIAPGAGGQSKLELTESFARLLDGLAPGERAAIIIDEAQELGEETLEELRLLSNTDVGEERRLQMVFVGQPELMERLASARMRSLNQRIGARALLNALQPAEVREYIECRLRAKGGAANRIFASAALNYLVAHSRGIPRRVNVLCHNSMLLGYGAGAKKVSVAMAKSAVSEYEDLIGAKRARGQEPAPAPAARPSRRLSRAALAMAALALAALGAFYVWSSQSWFVSNPLHATVGGVAIRPVVGPTMTGPRVQPRPVAPAARQAPTTAVMFATSIAPALLPLPGELSPSKTPPPSAAAATAASPPIETSTGAATAGAAPQSEPPQASMGAKVQSGVAKVIAQTRSIRVRYGDTLLKIADRYLGSPEGLNQLLDANPQLRDIDRIYPGEIVNLPPVSAAVARQ